MKCEKCRTREATVHVMDIIGDLYAETDLCVTCAAGEGLGVGPPDRVIIKCPRCGEVCEAALSEGTDVTDVTCSACGSHFKVKFGNWPITKHVPRRRPRPRPTQE